MDAAVCRTVYFAHQSVGDDVIAGLEEVAPNHPEIRLELVHDRVGTNTKPLSKFEDADEAGNPSSFRPCRETGQDQDHPEKGASPPAGGSEFLYTFQPSAPQEHGSSVAHRWSARSVPIASILLSVILRYTFPDEFSNAIAGSSD